MGTLGTTQGTHENLYEQDMKHLNKNLKICVQETNMRTLGTTYAKKTYEIKIMEIMENKVKTT
jgi:hypothetical protein